MAITPISSTMTMPAVAPAADSTQAASGESFQAVFANAVKQVGALQSESEASVRGFLSGDGGELHEVALAAQRAELAFEMLQQVRNKIVQAYQEVMRMQL